MCLALQHSGGGRHAAMASIDTGVGAADPLRRLLASKEAMQLRQEALLSVMVSGRSAQGLAGVRQGCGGRWAIRCLASTGPRCAWLLPQASWAGGARLVQRQGGKAEAMPSSKGVTPSPRRFTPSSAPAPPTPAATRQVPGRAAVGVEQQAAWTNPCCSHTRLCGCLLRNMCEGTLYVQLHFMALPPALVCSGASSLTSRCARAKHRNRQSFRSGA